MIQLECKFIVKFIEYKWKTLKIVLLIYDITNQNSFNNLNKWYKQVRNMNNSDKIFSIVSNKCDI
jgi:GTPase SAR1 family protein